MSNLRMGGEERDCKNSIMVESTEELQPLFDYSRVQPDVVCLDGQFSLTSSMYKPCMCLYVSVSLPLEFADDDCSDSSPAFSPKRRKLSDTAVKLSNTAVEMVEKTGKVIQVIDCEENEEDDWLPPPPKFCADVRKISEDSTLKELRLKKQELESFAKSAEKVLRSVELSMKTDFNASVHPALESAADQSSKPSCERAKIVISIQEKEGAKQFRVYKDDKFERLFKNYAEKNNLELQRLVFCFDGDKVSPTATPDELGMEDEDLIEVHVK